MNSIIRAKCVVLKPPEWCIQVMVGRLKPMICPEDKQKANIGCLLSALVVISSQYNNTFTCMTHI